MSKKFTKTVLSTAMAGVFFGATFGVTAGENGVTEIRGDREALLATNPVINGIETINADINIGNDYTIKFSQNGVAASIVNTKTKQVVLGGINTKTGSVITINQDEFKQGSDEILKKHGIDISNPKNVKITPEAAIEIQRYIESIKYPVYSSRLKYENLKNLTKDDVDSISKLKDDISSKVTSVSAPDYISSIKSGGNSEAYLAALNVGKEFANEYNRIVTNLDAMNDDVELLNKTTAQTQKYTETKISEIYDDVRGSLSATEMKANKYTDQKTSEVSGKIANLSGRTDRIDAAVGAVDNRLESRTTVGVNSDGTLTRAEGAAATIAVNDGLVQLSGRTDRIDAAVGAIDGRVTRNTQSIEKNSKAIAANTRTLQQHSARLDSQQRQINENHKEMKRAAAQSAALTGLFQPYSVGKFNATAAVGGYSDQ
ncbi:hypothetical protein ACWJT8_26690, partial [Escherichia coli]